MKHEKKNIKLTKKIEEMTRENDNRFSITEEIIKIFTMIKQPVDDLSSETSLIIAENKKLRDQIFIIQDEYEKQKENLMMEYKTIFNSLIENGEKEKEMIQRLNECSLDMIKKEEKIKKMMETIEMLESQVSEYKLKIDGLNREINDKESAFSEENKKQKEKIAFLKDKSSSNSSEIKDLLTKLNILLKDIEKKNEISAKEIQEKFELKSNKILEVNKELELDKGILEKKITGLEQLVIKNSNEIQRASKVSLEEIRKELNKTLSSNNESYVTLISKTAELVENSFLNINEEIKETNRNYQKILKENENLSTQLELGNKDFCFLRENNSKIIQLLESTAEETSSTLSKISNQNINLSNNKLIRSYESKIKSIVEELLNSNLKLINKSINEKIPNNSIAKIEKIIKESIENSQVTEKDVKDIKAQSKNISSVLSDQIDTIKEIKIGLSELSDSLEKGVLKNLKNENITLVEEKKELEMKNAKLEKSQEMISTKLNSIDKLYKELQNNYESKVKEVEKIKEKNTETTIENKLNKEKLNQSYNEIESLKDLVEKLSGNEPVETYKSMLIDFEKKYSTLEAVMNQNSSEWSRSKQKYEKNEEAFNEKISHLTKEKEESLKEVSTLKEQINEKEAQISKIKTENELLQRELKDLNVSYKYSVGQLEIDKQFLSKAIEALREEKSDIEKENERLLKHINSITLDNAKTVEELSKQIYDLYVDVPVNNEYIESALNWRQNVLSILSDEQIIDTNLILTEFNRLKDYMSDNPESGITTVEIFFFNYLVSLLYMQQQEQF